MSRWLDPGWYRHLWRRRLPFEAKTTIVLVLAAFVLVSGYFAANGLSSASGGTSSGADAYILQTTTITKLVTLEKNGKTIVKRYPVVHTVRIRAKAVTIRESQTVTTPQGVKTIPVVRVRYVPLTRTVNRVVDHVVTNVVTKNGKTRTVVTNRRVTVPVKVQQNVPVTVSQTQVVTNERTLTNERTTTNNVINEHTETVVTTRPVTTTVASPPDTTTVIRTHESTTTEVVTTVETKTETKTLPQATMTIVVTVVTVTVSTQGSGPG